MFLSQEFQQITPTCCNATFAVPIVVYNEWLRTKSWWYCPSCGSHRHFVGESYEQKLKRLENERDAARRRTESEYRSKLAIKGHLTRTKNRIANGVCPCCKRHFNNVERHMRSQHPEFAVPGKEGA